MKKIIQFVASKIRNRKVISNHAFLAKVAALNRQIEPVASKAAHMLDTASVEGNPYIYNCIKYKDLMEVYNKLSKERRKLIGI